MNQELGLKVFKQTNGIKQYIPFKYELLNYILTTDFSKGLPIGRMTELFGDPQSGKSTLGYSAIASTQALGGIAILVETEDIAEDDWLQTNGIDTDLLIRLRPQSVSNAINILVSLIDELESSNHLISLEAPRIIVWDSLGATQADEGKDFAQSVLEGLPQLLNKIRNKYALLIINQMRQMFNILGSYDVTLGGQTVYQNATMRLKTEFKESDRSGTLSKIKCIKNTVSDPGRECRIFIDKGVNIDRSTELTYYSINPRGEYGEESKESLQEVFKNKIKGVF